MTPLRSSTPTLLLLPMLAIACREPDIREGAPCVSTDQCAVGLTCAGSRCSAASPQDGGWDLGDDQQAQAEAPSACPGGRGAGLDAWLVFDRTSGFNRDLYAIHTDSCDVRRLTDAATPESQPVVSPDGQRLAFVTVRGGAPQVLVAELGSTQVWRLTAGEHPAWSPDSRTLAVAVNGGVSLVPLDGSPVRVLPLPEVTTLPKRWEHPVFIAGGQQIVALGPQSLVSFDLEGRKLRDLVNAGTSALGRPAFPLDERAVLYQSFCSQNSGIYSAPVDATTTGCLGSFVASGWEPSFGPNEALAMTVGEYLGPRGVAVMAGGQVVPLTSGTDDRSPSWWPSGAALPAAPLVLPED